MNITEQQLLKNLKEGDKNAPKALYDKFVGSLAAVCSRYIVDDDDVKDVLQESFIKIFTQINTFTFHGDTGVGRVFLSHMSEAAQKWVYENNADAIGMTQDEFLAMLRKARHDGYALDDQAFNAGLRCVAAPIYLGGNKLLFAMSISAPTARMDDTAYEKARKLALKYADLISQEMQSVEFRF